MMGKDFRANNFDLIRITAATIVLINHSFAHLKLATPCFYKPLQHFHGVPMFFVISGYLLSASIERNGNLKNYFTNRVLRIYPALWTCIIVTTVLFALMGVNFFSKSAGLWFASQMAGVIYTPGFLKDFGFGSYNGSLWTIIVELQFYFLLPLIYFTAKWFNNKFGKSSTSNFFFYLFFALSFLFALGVKLYFDSDKAESQAEKFLRYSILQHVFIFMTGVVLQRLQIHNSRFIRGKALYWIAGYLAFAYLVPESLIKGMAKLLLLAPCTISIAYSLPHLSAKYLKNLDISYGVYLYHGLLLTIFVELNITGSYYHFLAVLVISYILGFLSYRFVEAPAMALAKKTKKARTMRITPGAPQVVVAEQINPVSIKIRKSKVTVR